MSNIKKANVINQIRKMFSDGMGQREIARFLCISRNTVARYLAQNPGGPGTEPSRIRDATPGVAQFETDATPGFSGSSGSQGSGFPDGDPRSLCHPFSGFIREELALGLSGMRIYQDLVEEKGFCGSYPSVKRFIRRLGCALPPVPFRRLDKKPGEEMQVDFGLGAPIPNGKRSWRPPVISCTLSYSRRSYVEAMPKQDLECFIRGIENAFRYFGGVTQKLNLDNLKAAVVHSDWFDPDLTPKFSSFCQHYGVCPLPCHVRMPRHKGRVERSVAYFQDNALKGRRFQSLNDMNLHLRKWMSCVADHRIHGTSKRQVSAMFEEEKPSLAPLPPMLFECFSEKKHKVHSDGHVEVNGAYYSAPPEYTGKEVWVRTDARTVRLLSMKQEMLCVHCVVEKGRTSTLSNHVPAEKYYCGEKSPSGILNQIETKIGRGARAWGEKIALTRKAATSQVLYGLFHLCSHYPAEEIEFVCNIALSTNWDHLSDIKRKLAEHSGENRQPALSFAEHGELIRNLDFYDGAVGTQEAFG